MSQIEDNSKRTPDDNPDNNATNNKNKQEFKAGQPPDELPSRGPFIVSIIALAISGLAAFFAWQSSDRAWESAKIANRAYVVLDNTQEPTGLKVGEVLNVISEIKNVGKTPAKNMLSSSLVRILSEAPSKEPDNPITEAPEIGGNFLGPNLTIQVVPQTHTIVNQDTLDGVKSGKLKIYVYTYTAYRDVFGNQQETATFVWYDYATKKYFSLWKFYRIT
jgi:hypothetical protein